MQKSLVIIGAALGFLSLGALSLILVHQGMIMTQRSQSQIHTTEFPAGLPCLNTAAPLTSAALHTGEVTTLKVTGRAIPTSMVGFEGMAWMDGETIVLPSHSLKAGAEGQLVLHFELPAGYKLNPAAPVHYEVYVHGEGIHVPNSGRPQSAHIIELPLTIPLQTMTGAHQATLDVEATFYWCRDDDTGLCLIQSTRWHVPVDTSEDGGPPSITLSTTAQLQDVAGAPVSPSAP